MMNNQWFEVVCGNVYAYTHMYKEHRDNSYTDNSYTWVHTHTYMHREKKKTHVRTAKVQNKQEAYTYIDTHKIPMYDSVKKDSKGHSGVVLRPHMYECV